MNPELVDANGVKTKHEFEVLNGGTQIEVSFREDQKTKETPPNEIIKIRKVPIRDMQSLARAWGQEDKEIPVYTQRSTEWTQTLTDESWEAVMEEGRRLNEAPFGRWFARQTKALEAMNQSSAVKAAIQQALLKADENNPTNRLSLNPSNG